MLSKPIYKLFYLLMYKYWNLEKTVLPEKLLYLCKNPVKRFSNFEVNLLQ